MWTGWETLLVCAWFVLAGALSMSDLSVAWVPQILAALCSFLALALCRTSTRP
jgi:hypothetical protein